MSLLIAKELKLLWEVENASTRITCSRIELLTALANWLEEADERELELFVELYEPGGEEP